jgi:hypothetical protein
MPWESTRDYQEAEEELGNKVEPFWWSPKEGAGRAGKQA